MKDVLGNLKIENLKAPVAVTGTFNSLILDTQGYQGNVAMAIHVGADSGTLDGSNYMTATFQETDTTADGDFAAVAAADIISAWPVLNVKATYENKTVVAECKPRKRYVRVRVVETGTVNAIFGVTGMVTVPRHAPESYSGGLAADGDAQT